MNVYSAFTIPAFGRHVTIYVYIVLYTIYVHEIIQYAQIYVYIVCLTLLILKI
jgi:hypothetical protein